MLRAAQALIGVAVLASLIACRTVTDPLPPQATLNVDVTDSMLGTQRAPLPAPQVVTWRVEAMTITNLPGFDGIYSFLYSGPCSYQLNVVAPVPFSNACRSSGITLKPDTGITAASVSVTISKLEVRVALRPDLSPDGDPDGDGIPTSEDVCPIVSNLNAADFAACQLPDQDLDGVPDALDNCLWYPSPPAPGQIVPADVDHDGIGDVCERIAPVILPASGSLTLQCDNVALTAPGSKITLLRMDFGQPGVLTCDPAFTGCRINPSAVRLALVGGSTSFPCHAVP